MMTFDLNSLLTLFLLYVRILSFLLVVPFFGREFLPNAFKVFLATALSLTLFMYADIKPLDFPTTGHFFLPLCVEGISLWIFQRVIPEVYF
ncbi:flagellar biosynthetic protein FliR [Thermocrinis sp.]